MKTWNGCKKQEVEKFSVIFVIMSSTNSAKKVMFSIQFLVKWSKTFAGYIILHVSIVSLVKKHIFWNCFSKEGLEKLFYFAIIRCCFKSYFLNEIYRFIRKFHENYKFNNQDKKALTLDLLHDFYTCYFTTRYFTLCYVFVTRTSAPFFKHFIAPLINPLEHTKLIKSSIQRLVKTNTSHNNHPKITHSWGNIGITQMSIRHQRLFMECRADLMDELYCYYTFAPYPVYSSRLQRISPVDFIRVRCFFVPSEAALVNNLFA